MKNENKKNEIQIRHLIYTVNELIVPRFAWDFGKNELKHKNYSYIPLPLRFRNLLQEKSRKWQTNFLEFTVGRDFENDLLALAIVHPKDNFSRKAGANIVKQRIKRMLDKKPLKNIPRTMYKLTREG